MTKPRLLLVTPRSPRPDGHGDQRRAHDIVTALSPEWDVEVVSWMPDCSCTGLRRWGTGPGTIMRFASSAMRMPATVAYVKARAPRSVAERVARGGFERALFVTHRAVPDDLPAGSVVDFIDDLGSIALRRAQSSRGPKSMFWRHEAARIQRFDASIAEQATIAIAHSSAEAAGISTDVGVVPLSVSTSPLATEGTRVLFFGNLYYAPNHEASMWMCRELAPRLRTFGVDPACLLLAGRRPRPALRRMAARNGVELRADVDHLPKVLAEAAVVLSPMALGTGTQYKVLDACGARRVCVITAVANAGLNLVDGQSALVRDRTADDFAEAIATLLADARLRERLGGAALTQVAPYLPENVGAAWRAAVRGDATGRNVDDRLLALVTAPAC